MAFSFKPPAYENLLRICNFFLLIFVFLLEVIFITVNKLKFQLKMKI